MRYFWHAIVSIVVLALIVFLFFAFSVRSEHRISFTDDLPELTEPTITVADPVAGLSDARVTIVNFGDYQCAACADVDEAIANLVADYPDNIRVVWKDMPNAESHDEALGAAMAARCAGKQDAFFTYNAYLFANQSRLGDDLYAALAQELGLKEKAFASCLENKDTLPLVQKSYEEGLALRVTATPTLFINGERYTGSISESALRAAVRGLLP